MKDGATFNSTAEDRLLLSRLKWTTLRNAVIALALFAANGFLLTRLDQPLLELANSEPKLDLRFGYDLVTVRKLLDAYGEDGRTIYVWNLIADTPFPIFGTIAVSMFVLMAFRDPFWRKFLVLPPLVFAATDLIENALLLSIVHGYPSLSPTLVLVTSIITQVKRTAFYASMLELILSVILIVRMKARPQPSFSNSE